MKRKLGGLLLAVGVALGLMAFRKQATPPDLSSPKAAVRSFLIAVKSRDTATIQQCIQGATDSVYLKQIFGDIATMQVVSVNNLIEGTTNNTAHVAAEITMEISSGQPNTKAVPVKMVDMFSLVKQGETWQLTPDPTFTNVNALLETNSIEKLFEARPLSFAIAFAGTPALQAMVVKAQAAAQTTSCISNAKQIGMGVRMYTEDYDDWTPRKGVSYKEIIFPYIKNIQTFTCPLDPKGTLSYTFNSNVAGIPLHAIPSPAKTVMIYEGKAGKLDYRHDGGAVVGFMDGHCALITPEETGSLIWTVKLPKTPVKPKPVKKKAHK